MSLGDILGKTIQGGVKGGITGGLGGGLFGAIGGLAGGMIANSKKKKPPKASNTPYVVDSNGLTVSRPLTAEEIRQKEANARIPGNVDYSQSFQGTPPYYIVYPYGWNFDTSKDKVLLDADGNYKGLDIAAYKDPSTKEAAYNFNTPAHNLTSSTFVKVKDDGTPDFSTAVVPDGKTVSPGVSTQADSQIPNQSNTQTTGGAMTTQQQNTQPVSAAISSLPANVQPGMQNWVSDTQKATNDYTQKEQQLWDEYLKFEDAYFNGAENAYTEYYNNMASIPSMSLAMPDSMGGAVIPMAPKQHISAYGADAQNKMNMLNDAMKAKLSGSTLLGNNAKDVWKAGITQAGNAFLPTQTALDLYKDALAYDQNKALHEQPDKSAWSTWAPVVGQVLQPDANGNSMIGSAVSTVKDWFSPSDTSWFSPSDTSGVSDTFSTLPDIWSPSDTNLFDTSNFGADFAGNGANLFSGL